MHRDFWIGTLTYVVIGLAVTGLFFVLSVALISPPSANRAKPVRLYITIIWLLGGLLDLNWIWQTKEVQLIAIWAFITAILMFFSLLVVISNSDQLSMRVRRTIPPTRLKRAFAFLFFNGAAGGLVWVALISAFTLFATTEIFSLGNVWLPKAVLRMSADQQNTFFTTSSTTVAYAFAYALTALFLQRKFFPKRPPKLAGLLAVLLAGAWAIAPSIVLFFLNQLSWKSVEGLQLGNVFNLYSLREGNDINLHLLFASVWLALMLALNANWFLQQAKNFRPPPSAPPVINEISPAA
jgi:hypothetical protein